VAPLPTRRRTLVGVHYPIYKERCLVVPGLPGMLSLTGVRSPSLAVGPRPGCAGKLTMAAAIPLFLQGAEVALAASAPLVANLTERFLRDRGIRQERPALNRAQEALGRFVVEPTGRAVARGIANAHRAARPDLFQAVDRSVVPSDHGRRFTAMQMNVEPNPGPKSSPMEKMKMKAVKQKLARAMIASAASSGGVGKSSAIRQVALSQAAQALSSSAGRAHQRQRASVNGERGIIPQISPGISKREERRDKDGNPVIIGSDYLAAAVITDPASSGNNKQGGLLLQYSLNPQQIVTASLAQYAQLYQKFEFLRVGVEYASSEAFTYGGSINCLWDSDVGDIDGSGLQLVQQAATTTSAHETPILRSTIWWYNTRREASGEYYVEEDLTTTAGSRQSIQGHCKVFVVNPVSFPTATPTYPLTIGSFIVHYVVRFYHRQIDITHTVGGTAVAIYRSNSSSNTAFYGGSFVANTPFNSLFVAGTITNPNTPLAANTTASYPFSFITTGIYLVSASLNWSSAVNQAGSTTYGVTFGVTVTGGAAIVPDAGAANFANGTFFANSGTTDAVKIAQMSAYALIRVTATPATFVLGLTSINGSFALTTGQANPRQFVLTAVPVDISGGVTLRSLQLQGMAIQAMRAERTNECSEPKPAARYRVALHPTILNQFALDFKKSPVGESAKMTGCGHEPARPTECGACALKYCQEKSLAGVLPVRAELVTSKGDVDEVIDGYIAPPSRAAATVATPGGFSARAVSLNVKQATPR